MSEQVPSKELAYRDALARIRQACRSDAMDFEAATHERRQVYDIANITLNAHGDLYASGHEPPAGLVAPIANVHVKGGEIVSYNWFTPGLPDGRHDLFPVPPDPRGQWEPWPSQPPADDALTLLREIDIQLRCAWTAGMLPHNVISASLAQRCAALLRPSSTKEGDQ